MEIKNTPIEGLKIIKPRVFADDRGYFFESYNFDKFEQDIPGIKFIQDNQSKSQKGVLRGLHYQMEPHAQSKLVRVLKGSVIDVAVDLRKSSPTFGEHFSIELSEENHLQLFIPKGFAHGFLTLEDETIFTYKVDNYYNKESERAIIYNDAELNVDWMSILKEVSLSEKDKVAGTFKEADYFE